MATEFPLISVVVPVRNRVSYLSDCLSSVIAADLGSALMEIVVVDNASDEPGKVEEIVAPYSKGRIRLVRHDVHFPLSENWNRCVDETKGAWVHVLHDDDIVMPHFYSSWLGVIREFPDIGIVASPVSFLDEKGNKKSSQDEANLFKNALVEKRELKAFLGGNPLRCPAVMFNRSCWEAIGKFRPEIAYAPDWICWFDLVRYKRGYFSTDIKAGYRDSPSSITNNLAKVFDWLKEIVAITRRNVREYRKQFGLVFVFRWPTFVNAAYRMVIVSAQIQGVRSGLATLFRILILPTSMPARIQLLWALGSAGGREAQRRLRLRV